MMCIVCKQFEHTQEHGSGMSSIQLVSLSKTILLGTLEEGWCHGQHRKWWLDNVKEWTSLPMAALPIMASHRKDWKRISAKSSLMSSQWPYWSRNSTELIWAYRNEYAIPVAWKILVLDEAGTYFFCLSMSLHGRFLGIHILQLQSKKQQQEKLFHVLYHQFCTACFSFNLPDAYLFACTRNTSFHICFCGR